MFVSSGIGRSCSKSSNSSVLKSGIPARKAAKGLSPSHLASLDQQQGPAGSYSPPNPSPFPWVIVKVHEKRMAQTKPGFQDVSPLGGLPS